MPEEIYRSCASIAVFRPSEACSPACPAKSGEAGRSGDGCDTVYQMLLVHKPRKKDCWQLPQGGCESGETTVEASLRELKEEAGIEAEVAGSADHVYQYDFPASYRRFRPDNVKGQRVEYVFATVEPDAKVQVDEEEIDQFAWVLPEELPHYIKRTEYLELVQKLYKDGTTLLS